MSSYVPCGGNQSRIPVSVWYKFCQAKYRSGTTDLRLFLKTSRLTGIWNRKMAMTEEEEEEEEEEVLYTVIRWLCTSQ